MLRFLNNMFVNEADVFYSTLDEISKKKKILDASCKKLLSNKHIISRIMKSCVDCFSDVSIDDIEEKYIVGTTESLIASVSEDISGSESAVTYDRDVELIEGTRNEDTRTDDGSTFFDVRFDVIDPKSTKDEVFTMIMNIEAQNEYYVGYPIIKRGIYYVGRMISAQHGTVFTNDNYGLLKPCIGIWICLKPPKYRQNTLNKYSIQEDRIVGDYGEEKKNYDLATVVMICLGDPDDGNCTGIVRMLSVIFSLKIDIDEKKRILSEEYGIKINNEMEREVTNVCNYAEAVWNEGMEKGILMSLKNLLLNNRHISLEEAMNLLGIAENDRPTYVEKLNV